MRLRQISLVASVLFGGGLVQAGLPGAAAQAQSAAALSGQVTSSEEGPMEGVLVSARRDGSSVTTTVVVNPGAFTNCRNACLRSLSMLPPQRATGARAQVSR